MIEFDVLHFRVCLFIVFLPFKQCFCCSGPGLPRKKRFSNLNWTHLIKSKQKLGLCLWLWSRGEERSNRKASSHLQQNTFFISELVIFKPIVLLQSCNSFFLELVCAVGFGCALNHRRVKQEGAPCDFSWNWVFGTFVRKASNSLSCVLFLYIYIYMHKINRSNVVHTLQLLLLCRIYVCRDQTGRRAADQSRTGAHNKAGDEGGV